MDALNVDSFEKMEIHLILGNEKLKAAYEGYLFEKIALNKKNEKMKAIDINSAIKKEKSIDLESESNHSELEESMYPDLLPTVPAQ